MSNESSFSFTTKIGNGNDLFTVRGDTFDEFLQNATLAYQVPAVKFVIDMLSGAEIDRAVSVIQDTLGGSVVAAAAPAFNNVVAATVTPTPAPATVNGRTCTHGVMSARQGVGKDGKTWRGYMCPAPQGATDKCKNVYIYPNQPEWHTFVAS